MNEQNALPRGWAATPLNVICTVRGGYAFRSSDFTTSGIPLVRIGDLSGASVEFSKDTVYLPEDCLERYESFTVKNGDILMALSGATTGKIGVYKRSQPAFLNQRVGLFIFDPRVTDTRFRRLLVSSIRQRVETAAYGAAQPNISPKNIHDFVIRLPPLNEQCRIVEKVDELFSDLDAGVAALDRAQANLKRYRAAVLKAAVEGRLTEKWRASHFPLPPGEGQGEGSLGQGEGPSGRGEAYEPADKLLARILAERRRRWIDAELTKWREKKSAAGWPAAKITAAKPDERTKITRKYKEPALPDVRNLLKLPTGWCWVTLDQLSFIDVGFAFRSAEFSNDGIRLLRGENLEPGALRWNDTRFWAHEKLNGFEHLLVREGDIILAMDRPLISAGLKLARAKASDVPCLLVQRMARFRFLGERLEPFIYIAMQTQDFLTQLLGGQTGTQLPHVSGTGIGACAVPLAPLVEQKAIADEIERRMSILTQMNVSTRHMQKRVKRLRQSILKRAFEGKLVPQDPNDEPADVLLERIRAARAAESNGNITTKNRRRKSASKKRTT
jgi:type I restriction enzyme S subunit